MFIPCSIHFSYWTAENVCYCSLMKCFCLITQKEKAKNFKRQIIKYLESLLQSQQQVSVCLSVRREIKYFSCETSWCTFIMVSMLRKALSTTVVLVLTVTEIYLCLKVYCLLVVHVLHCRPLAGDLIQKAFMSAAVQ